MYDLEYEKNLNIQQHFFLNTIHKTSVLVQICTGDI